MNVLIENIIWLHQEIQLMLNSSNFCSWFYYFPDIKGSSLLHVILSMLMMLFFTIDVIDLLIWGNSLNWPLNLNLVFQALWIWIQSGFLILLWRFFIIYFIYYFTIVYFFKMSDIDVDIDADRDRFILDEILRLGY